MPSTPHNAIFQATIDHYLAPIKGFLDDTSVAEVMVNHANEIYIERGGKLEKTTARFTDEEAYEAAVNNILQFTGKTLTDLTPLIDARLPDGSRVHVAKAPCARNGTVMTIRKFSKAVLDVDWLVQIGTISEASLDYLKLIINRGLNVLVSGGTSTGKTSLLNALSAFIPDDQRIVVIEDSAELQLQKSHVVSLEARAADRYGHGQINIRDLFKSSLRLRPDRIIVGEVRGGEALDMIQAMTSGHGGSMGTLHADSPLDTLNRLETLCLMSEVELPLHAIRGQIASAIDVVVQMNRSLGGARVISHIAEVLPLNDRGAYDVSEIFSLSDPPAGSDEKPTPVWTGAISKVAGHLNATDRELLTEPSRAIFTPEASAH